MFYKQLDFHGNLLSKFKLLLVKVAFNNAFKPMLDWHENGYYHGNGYDMDDERFLPQEFSYIPQVATHPTGVILRSEGTKNDMISDWYQLELINVSSG